MKLFVLLCLAASQVGAYGSPSLEQEVFYLRQEVQALRAQVDQLSRQLYAQPVTYLTLTKIDTFFHRITLSNGKKYSYSVFSDYSIEHWLEGQPIQLELASQKGYVRIHNMATNDWIEAEKCF